MKLSMLMLKLSIFWERLIVPISRHLGKLEKTYLGNPRLPNFGNRSCRRLNANVWTGNFQILAFKLWHPSWSADLADIWMWTYRLQMLECRCLNRHRGSIQTSAIQTSAIGCRISAADVWPCRCTSAPLLLLYYANVCMGVADEYVRLYGPLFFVC